MITCPTCAQSLPDWSQSCQFCNTDVRSLARPVGGSDTVQRGALTQTAGWIWPAYYLCSAYFILSGLYTVISGVIMMANRTSSPAGDVMQTISIFMMIVGGITALIGIGLVAKVEFFRGVVNILCWIRIVGAGFGLFSSLLAGAFVGPAALLAAGINVFDLVTAGLMIYLIGETD